MPLIKAYITHKRAEQYKDCQDSFCISIENNSIAVADGISQSIFPKKWADMLTSEYVNNPEFSLSDISLVTKLRSNWMQFFKHELEKQQRENAPLVWKLEDCYNEGKSAGATFIGVKFRTSSIIDYEVLGDSCIVVTKNKEIQEVISSKESSDSFDNYPDYIDSNVKIGIKGNIKKGNIEFENNMEVFLVTDALSEIMSAAFHSDDRGKNLIENLSGIYTHLDFVSCIESLRDNGMSNDDTTMVHIEKTKHNNIKITDQTNIEELITQETSSPDSINTTDSNTHNTEQSERIQKKSCMRSIANLFNKKTDMNIENADKYVDNLIEKNLPQARAIIKDYLFGSKKE